MDLSIVGIGTVSVNPAEYTTHKILDQYLANIRTLKEVFDKRASNPNSTTPLTVFDYNQLIFALRNLSALAKNGVVEEDGSTSFLNMTMANQLNDLMKSLKAVGLSPSSPDFPSISDPPTEEQLEALMLVQQWQNLAGFGVEEMLAAPFLVFSAYTAEVKDKLGQIRTIEVTPSPTRTLQSMVEVEYIKNANELIFNRLASLEEALHTTQDIIGTLTLIQNIANQIQISDRQPPFRFPPVVNADIPSSVRAIIAGMIPDFLGGIFGSLEEMLAADAANGTNTFASGVNFYLNQGGHDRFYDFYKAISSAYFSKLFPSAVPITFSGLDLLNAKQLLAAQLAELQQQNPTAAASANSLAANLMKVIKDISAHFVQSIQVVISSTIVDPDLPPVVVTSTIKISLSAGSDPALLLQALKTWILDGQDVKLGLDVENTAGLIQDNIGAAIRTAENLNDTQKEDVRRYLFLFEEFYKSAGNILRKLTDLLEKIAKGANQ